MKTADEAFAKTTKLLFGKELHPIDDYEEWLLKRIPKGEMVDSCTSNRKVFFPGYSVFKYVPKGKAAGLDSLNELSNRKIEVSGSDSLKSISPKLGSIAIYITEFVEGENQDVIDSTIYKDLFHAYKIVDCFDSKHIAYNFWTDRNEYTFGTYRTFDAKFCIHCYNSKNVMMSFELDACKSCSGLMFSHNCENVHDSLFCFNTKNKRYAVANHELGKEEFLKVKGMLVDYILKELEKNRYLKQDIYNIGCAGSKP